MGSKGGEQDGGGGFEGWEEGGGGDMGGGRRRGGVMREEGGGRVGSEVDWHYKLYTASKQPADYNRTFGGQKAGAESRRAERQRRVGWRINKKYGGGSSQGVRSEWSD